MSDFASGAPVLDEEEGCIKVIATSLFQVSNRLNGVSTLQDPNGAQAPLVSTAEATEFVDMLSRILAKSQGDSERLRVLAFEVDPKLVDVLVSLLQTPQVSIEGDPLALLFVSVCRCLVILLCACCKLTSPEQLSSSEEYLGKLCCDIFERCNTVIVLSTLLGPTSSNDVNYAASDCLFALLLRSAESRNTALNGDSVTSLVNSLGSNSDAPFRANVSVCIRELANVPSPVLAENEPLLKVLVRVLALDTSADVRTMCIESLDVLYKRERQAWATCPIRKELATAAVDRLERDESSEVLEAMSKLVETLLIADIYVEDGGRPGNNPHQVETHTFAETFIAISGDRALIQCCMLAGRVATLAARAFRTLVQRAPFYRYVPYNIFAHFPSLTVLLKKLIELNRGENERIQGQGNGKKEDTVLLQILKVELTMAFCVMLAADPRCRQVLASNLYEHPHWAQQLRAAILSHLQAAALEYFADVEVMDCTGNLVNNIDAVIWETDLRPTRSSVEKVFEDQDERWATLTNGEEPVPRNIQPSNMDAVDRRAREMRLTYILLSYAAHCTLQDIVTPAAQKAQASPQKASSRSPERGPKGPLPTRTSILREWSAKPEKLAALKRAAADPSLIDRATGGQDSYNQALTEAGGRAGSPGRKNTHKSATFSKFDAALSLCTSFAQYYDRVGDPQPVIYETTPDGHFARRQPHRAAWFGASRAMKTKTWTLDTLREGDLFFFGIPITALNSFALEQVRNRAIRHMNHIKRSFVITPQNAKDRRWFLYDMLNHIMPGIIHALNELLEVFNTHGDEDAKFPIVMLRQNELANSTTPIQQDDTVHSGNLLDVIDQCSHYFRNMTDKKQEAQGGAAMSSQFLRDLEFKIKSLQTQEFSGNETNLMMGGPDRDDDVESVDSVVSNAEPAGFSAARRRMNGFGDDMSDITDF